MKNKIQAIIFDLDNTLIDRQRAFKEMLERKIPQYLSPKETAPLETIIEDILLWDANGTLPRITTFTNLFNKYSLMGTTPEELDSMWSKESGSTTYLFPDVLPTLIYLKGKVKLGILSNGNASSQRRKLETINIYQYFDFTLVSGEFEVNKPDPRIFEYTAEKLKTPISNCLYVGDNYKIDVLGSQNAGMQSLYVDRFNQPHPETLTIHEIAELKELF